MIGRSPAAPRSLPRRHHATPARPHLPPIMQPRPNTSGHSNRRIHAWWGLRRFEAARKDGRLARLQAKAVSGAQLLGHARQGKLPMHLPPAFDRAWDRRRAPAHAPHEPSRPRVLVVDDAGNVSKRDVRSPAVAKRLLAMVATACLKRDRTSIRATLPELADLCMCSTRAVEYAAEDLRQLGYLSVHTRYEVDESVPHGVRGRHRQIASLYAPGEELKGLWHGWRQGLERFQQQVSARSVPKPHSLPPTAHSYSLRIEERITGRTQVRPDPVATTTRSREHSTMDTRFISDRPITAGECIETVARSFLSDPALIAAIAAEHQREREKTRSKPGFQGAETAPRRQP
jgi:hypothetical protein